MVTWSKKFLTSASAVNMLMPAVKLPFIPKRSRNLLPSRSNQVTMPPTEDVTTLLQAWSRGDQAAEAKLIPLVYDTLRQVAQAYLQRRPGQTLQPTDLVHEAYLKLIPQRHVNWQNRSHFYGIAARMMRRVLADHARRRRKAERVTLDSMFDAPGQPPLDIVALDEALRALESVDPQKCRIVELRYFGGLTVEETAQALRVSTSTVVRQWRAARAWLYRELRKEMTGDETAKLDSG